MSPRLTKAGGAREGSGRPAIFDKPTAATITFRITAEQAARLDAEGEEGESRNQTARRLMLGAFDRDSDEQE